MPTMDNNNGMDYNFESKENLYQQKFQKIKLPFTPCMVLSVHLLGFRNVSVGYSDFWDTPDPQFTVTCPKIKRTHLRQFKTRCIKDNVTKGFIGQTFKFVLPKDFPPEESFPVQIELSDRDLVFDDVIGTQTIDASTIPANGSVFSKTLEFDGNGGKLDIKISKAMQNFPDFRYSLGLCEEEISFRRKRLPKVYADLRRILGERGPRGVEETPVVALVGSGGGYRAMIGMCGVMEALRDADLLDVFMYNCGLSGSAWYFTCGYTMRGVKDYEQQQFHDKLRQRMSSNLMWDMINPLTIKAYQEYLDDSRKRYGQPYTFANYFPGFLVGRQLLKNQMMDTLSGLTPYIENADIPYPILVALHVKNRLKASVYHAYVERSPYEINIPSYGIGLHPKNEGSTWNSGVLVREFPEYPIHFTIAMTGCAFSILLNSYLATGGELNKDFIEYIENERLNGKKKANKNLEETNRAAEIESEESDDEDSDEAVAPTWGPDSALSSVAASAFNAAAVPASPSPMAKTQLNPLQKMIRSSTFFSTRNGIIGRTARLFNYALGLEKIERFMLNPFFHEGNHVLGESKDIIDKFGFQQFEESLSTNKNILSFVDAGILKNVPTDSVLRPQRTTDLMIVCDFSAYESDENFSYVALLSAAAQAWQSGLEFPNINFEEITNMPPKEFLIFPSHGPSCPTVLWFTLSNRRFRAEKNYVPKASSSPNGESQKFNDFTVFGEDTPYSTFSFQYDNYHFDRLKELMYYNVTSHIEEIKEALADAVLRKRSKL